MALSRGSSKSKVNNKSMCSTLNIFTIRDSIMMLYYSDYCY